MLMNNLDPEVAERPEDLVVYGGTGRAARSWEAFDAIVRALRGLEGDETLLVQSGKPVGVFRTHADAPRVLIANANLVPAWATWETFRDLEDRGLTMYGQMTAGSWIYIGTQGILQGTYETLAALAARHFGGTLAGRLTVTAGLGGMGGAQPLAVTMNGGVALVVEVDEARIARRLATRYLDEATDSLDDALARCAEWTAAGTARSIALRGNAAEVLPAIVARGLVPDVVTDQTSAHDAVGGYVPDGLTLAQAAALRAADPRAYEARSVAAMGRHVAAMLALKRRGAVVFDYGNNIRAQAVRAGVADAFEIPGFVPEYVRPLFCEGKGPFRWAVLSGDPADLRGHRRGRARDVRRRRGAVPLDPARAGAGRVPGPAGADLLARLRRAGALRAAAQPAGARGARVGADRHRPRSPRRRLGGLAQPRDRGHARRQRRHRRLAAAERAAEHRRRRDLGVDPPRRRRRHRLLDSRRDGGRGRRHAPRPTAASSACSPATRAWASSATPTPAIPKRGRRPARAACACRWRTAAS